MAQNPSDIERIEAARRLYIKYEGKQLDRVEQEMRALGFYDFHRRILHPRFERGKYTPGWIERFGFDEKEFTAETPSRGETEEILPQINADNADNTEELSTATSTATEAKAEKEQENSPQINADNADKAEELSTATASGSDPRHLRRSAAESLPFQETPEKFVSDFDHFQAWLKDVSPEMTWDWKHQVYIYKRLKKVSDGLCKRLMIFLPPRHGKSELVTVRYTAWRMKQDPKMNVILGSYNQRLANRFSRKIKKVLMDDFALTAETQRRGEDEGTHSLTCDHACNHTCNAEPRTETTQINGKTEGCRPCTCKENSSPRLGDSAVDPNASPFPFIRNTPKNTESEWETAVGGGLRAVGVGSGVTGFGANLIVIDDPVKSRAEAESSKMREKVWHWFNDDIYTRLEPGGSVVLIQTRWHEDDLAGRLLREPIPAGGEKWTVVNLPALAEGNLTAEKQRSGEDEEMEKEFIDELNINMETKPSKNISPNLLSRRLGVSAVKISADPLGRNSGEALCPERYDIEELKRLREKIGSYAFASLYQQRPVPAEGGMFKRKWFEPNIVSAAPAGLRWKRGTDPGVSAGEKADYSASVRVAIDRSGNMYIADVYRRQVEYPELRRFIVECLKTERNTEHAIELAGHGNAIHQDLLKEREIQGRAFRGIKATDPKLSRALGWLALAEAGKVFLVRGAWNEEFLNEIASFPMGTHDDQVDAVSLAFALAATVSKKCYGF